MEPTESAVPVKSRAKRGSNTAKLTAEGSGRPAKRALKTNVAKISTTGDQSTSSQKSATVNTPLQIPYGNKEVAQKLGARYAAGGWYAPPGVDLATFRAQGWL